MTRIAQESKSRFYQITEFDIQALRRQKLINNNTLVYLVLKLENPWCDRAVHIESGELCRRWNIPVSSFYQAIAKLKSSCVIDIEQGSITIRWKSSDNSDGFSNPRAGSGNSDQFSDSKTDSDNSEPILESQNEFLNPRIDSEIPESGSLEPIPDKASSTPHTIQTISDHSDSLSYNEPERETRYCTKGEKSKFVPIATALEPIKARESVDAIATLDTEQDIKPSQEFLDWVIDKVKQFPNPPIFPKTVALNLIKREGSTLLAEYKECIEQSAQLAERVAETSKLISSPKDVSREEAKSIDSIFARLRAKWSTKFRQQDMRAAVINELRQHPEWNIRVNGDRLELAA